MPAPAPAAGATATRAVRIALPGAVPAAHAALLVAGDERPFALVGRWAGAAALVGSAPLRVAGADDDPFALLDAQPAVGGDVPDGFVGGGWFGLLGYGLGRRLEALGPPPPVAAGERRDDALLAFHDHLLRLDADGRWWFEALWTEARAEALEARRAVLAARLEAGAATAGPGPVATRPWRATPSPEGHARVVAACRERIAAGDLFQANLSLRLRSALTAGTPADLFCHGVAALAPDRAAFVAGPQGAVASLSPELLVTRHGDVVRSAPIKGTRPRPADPARAAAQRAALEASAKDRAENVMIVDLVRNDLGRVCVPGSVVVEALAEARPHAGVWHLVSEVAGLRRPGVGDGALAAALFPPGSVTGAPKLAAMDVISALESTGRQAFCGALGFASPTAGLELSVAIRTFEVGDGVAWLDVGGGVVADSDPDAEAAECLAKARPLLAAIGARLAGDPAPAPGPVPLRLGPHPVPRPDPRRGIFETLLVTGGVAVAAERHLERLARGARELYGLALPPSLPALVAHAALEQGGPCRLRVLLDADGAVALDVAPAPAAGAPVDLRAVTVPGGLGPRKWRDRRLLEALEAAVAPAAPLLVDLDGAVLETSRSCVLAVVDGVLVSPAPDGRLLPGVTCARVLEGAAGRGLPVDRRPLALAELAAADGAFVVNALRGLQPVTQLDGAALAAPDDRYRTLGADLPQSGE
jgi:para-aminobenzoate synthetase/4-amino-4-deoxychorismate lyase